ENVPRAVAAGLVEFCAEFVPIRRFAIVGQHKKQSARRIVSEERAEPEYEIIVLAALRAGLFREALSQCLDTDAGPRVLPFPVGGTELCEVAVQSGCGGGELSLAFAYFL